MPRKNMTPEERKAWGAKMKAAREAKAADSTSPASFEEQQRALDEQRRKEVVKAYQRGTNSIQDLARIYHMSIDEVLHLTGNGQLSKVDIPGDMIDQTEAGDTPLNFGKEVKVPYTTH